MHYKNDLGWKNHKNHAKQCNAKKICIISTTYLLLCYTIIYNFYYFYYYYFNISCTVIHLIKINHILHWCMHGV